MQPFWSPACCSQKDQKPQNIDYYPNRYREDANAWFSRLGVRKEENVLASKRRDVLGCGRMERGEVGRLGVRRQETGEQGSPSESRRDKKEREGKPLHYQPKENRERRGVGVGCVEGSH